MKLYVASSWRNPHQPDVINVLRSAGHEVYDFRNPAPGNTGFSWRQTETPNYKHGDLVDATTWRRMVNHPIARKGFAFDFNAMHAADACVFVLPAGRSASFELGWCMGQGKPGIVLALEPTEPELMFRKAAIVGSLAEMLDYVDEFKRHLTQPLIVNGRHVCGRTLPPTAVPICGDDHRHAMPHVITSTFMFDDDGNPWVPVEPPKVTPIGNMNDLLANVGCSHEREDV